MKAQEAYNIGLKLGELGVKIDENTKQFTNHLSHHKQGKILGIIQTLIIVGMFCFLKWGLK